MTVTASPASRYALYRYFDTKGALLYIGISRQLTRRDKSHIDHSAWTQFATSSTIERCKDKAEARETERAAILAERPIFNKEHNGTPEALERLRAYLEGVGRLDLLPGCQRKARSKTAATENVGLRTLGIPMVLDTAKLDAAIKSLMGFRAITLDVVAAETGLSASTITRLSQGQKPDADALVTLLAWLKADVSAFAIPRPANDEGQDR